MNQATNEQVKGVFSMERLSRPAIELHNAYYDVVVVGSGYGGSIAASRLARARKKVCLLERGREIHPGEFPKTRTKALKEIQVDMRERHLGSSTGLYDFRVNEDINVLLGCGLGGTSLINAGVSLRADQRVFEGPKWPEEFRNNPAQLDEFYKRAEEMLQPTRYPEERSLYKLEALAKSATAFRDNDGKIPISCPPINVTFAPGPNLSAGPNAAGVTQYGCTDCGDCVTGCNVGAKNTTLMNYLPDAKLHGAEIFTGAKVTRVSKSGDRWVVHFQPQCGGEIVFSGPEHHVRAEIVILSCGTLGSTEILLRSRAAGLSLSDKLGKHFTGNGDVISFGYNTDIRIQGIGRGKRKVTEKTRVGPCITGLIDLRYKAQRLEDGIVIEEGSIPGPLAVLSPRLFPLIALFYGRETKRSAGELFRQTHRALASLFCGPYTGSVRNTQTYLVMSHDQDGGEMFLEEDRLSIRWPHVGEDWNFQSIDKELAAATEPLGGVYLNNPVWSSEFNWELATAHPLGGCIMGDNAKKGVVNHQGQVFDGNTGNLPHKGLYVCDGSIVPSSLGVNPLLTISALAERCCHYICKEKDRSWRIDYGPNTSVMLNSPTLKTPNPGFQFTERMSGRYARDAMLTNRTVKDDDIKNGIDFEFVLNVQAVDLAQMLSEPKHRARLSGTVNAQALSSEALTVTKGIFKFLVNDQEGPEALQMRYRFKMVDVEGKRYFFDGFKRIRNSPFLRVWPDTTTLYFTLYGQSEEARWKIGSGILRIQPLDFLKELTTLQITNATLRQRIVGLAKYGVFFNSSLYQHYCGLLAAPIYFKEGAAPKPKPKFESPPPEEIFFKASDGVRLRLTRYNGGRKGPVMLVHGLGVSSRIFSADLIDTNLVKSLCKEGYDVWLLDSRVSIELPVSRTPSNGDRLAGCDYPAAIRKVLTRTGARSLQCFADGWGAPTFFMSLLRGELNGLVRSFVASQIGMYICDPPKLKFETALVFADFLSRFGIPRLDAYARSNAAWYAKLYDKALQAWALKFADGRCNSATCHRVTFLHGSLYAHDHLNNAFHDRLHEIFGISNLETIQHILKFCIHGKLIDFNEQDVYLPNIDYLNIPIAIIQGAECAPFLIKGADLTYHRLCSRFGEEQYAHDLVSGYRETDCIFGKNAVRDVYPLILTHLEKYPHP